MQSDTKISIYLKKYSKEYNKVLTKRKLKIVWRRKDLLWEVFLMQSSPNYTLERYLITSSCYKEITDDLAERLVQECCSGLMKSVSKKYDIPAAWGDILI